MGASAAVKRRCATVHCASITSIRHTNNNAIHEFALHMRVDGQFRLLHRSLIRKRFNPKPKWNSGQFNDKLHKIEIECSHILNAN